MNVVDTTVRVQRWLLVAMVVATTVALVPPAVEPFMLPKATSAVVLALGLAATACARAVLLRRIRLPVSAATWAVAMFALALVVVTITSTSPWTSFIGFYGRYTGLVPYLAYIVAFLAVLRVHDERFPRVLRRACLATSAVVTAYGFLQVLGADPVAYLRTSTFSVFGNVNFAAGWTGAASVLALTTVADAAERRAWRVAAAVLLPLMLVYLTQTSLQGMAAAAVALAFGGAVVATDPDSRVRSFVRTRRRPAAMIAAAGLVVAGAVAAVGAPLLASSLRESLVERPAFWRTAVRIFADNPLVGTGLDTYAHYFMAARPAEHAVRYGPVVTDAPHSVPLGMFSNGGLLLGVTYLVVVVAVGVLLVRGLLTARGAPRLVLATWGGVWLGYQVQSLVSFDVPPLALLHWVSAGVIVASSGAVSWRELSLPGAAAAVAVDRRGRAKGPLVVPAASRVILGVLGVVLLAVAWLAGYPLRADLAAAQAASAGEAGRLDEATDLLSAAGRLNPAEATYPFQEARGHNAAGRLEDAFAALTEAARRDPGTVQYAALAGQAAEQAGRRDEALLWYEEAVSRDPNDPRVLFESAGFFLAAGEVEQAETLLERSLRLRQEARSLLLLAEVRIAQGDRDSARTALEQALALEPGSREAQEALDTLPGRG